MITQWQSGETIVGRLRVKGARIDPALAQLRLATLLNSAVSQPTAFPPSAIVFIRKLHDPLPRSIRLQQHDLRPPVAWQQALNAKLESLATGAARPALGAVPANAQAVVFLDRSELLASLASDWCEGQVAMRWWWQCLLKKTTASQIIKDVVLFHLRHVEHAIDHLDRGFHKRHLAFGPHRKRAPSGRQESGSEKCYDTQGLHGIPLKKPVVIGFRSFPLEKQMCCRINGQRMM